MQHNTRPVGSRMNAMEDFEQALLRLCNAARFDCGLAPLRADPRLHAVAQSHAQAMALGGYFDHVDTQGRAVGERLMAAGFRYRRAGENISAGKDRIDDVFHWWMSSEGHRANILTPAFAAMGAGHHFIEPDIRAFHHYWVLVMATEQADR
jgi:uncharacterized protein YkwD